MRRLVKRRWLIVLPGAAARRHFLGSHASFFGMWDKIRQRAEALDPAEEFIDPDGYLACIDRAEERFRRVLADQRQR